MMMTTDNAPKPCWAVLMLLLLGVSQSCGQCLQKMTECAQLQVNIGTEITPHLTSSPPNVTALEHACSTIVPRMGSCVREARASCSDQPDVITQLDTLETALDSYCGPGIICQLKAGVCQGPLLAVLPTGPPTPTNTNDTSNTQQTMETLQKLCPVYDEVKQCLQDLTATEQCRNEGSVKNISSALELASSSCAAFGGTGQMCPQSFACFTSFAAAAQPTGRCQSMKTYLQCLSGIQSTCNFDESKISFADLQSLASSMCTDMEGFPAEYQNCSAVEQCVMTDPDLGLSSLAGSETFDMSQMTSTLSRITDPVFLCRYLQVSVKCSVTGAASCQYSDQYIAVMTSQRDKLQQSCPKSDQSTSDGTVSDDGSGAERPRGHVTHWLVTAATIVTTTALLAV